MTLGELADFNGELHSVCLEKYENLEQANPSLFQSGFKLALSIETASVVLMEYHSCQEQASWSARVKLLIDFLLLVQLTQ